jgi:hypothetical protein
VVPMIKGSEGATAEMQEHKPVWKSTGGEPRMAGDEVLRWNSRAPSTRRPEGYMNPNRVSRDD